MIEVEGLTKRYDDTTVVREVSFRVAQGELLALIGGSGSGKTTTLKMINRLIDPSSGTVRIDGEDVTSVAAHLLRRRMGYVFQKIGLFPHLSVEQNVAVPLRLHGWSRHDSARRVTEVLQLVELDPEIARRRPSQLSGGQQQRVGVARALAARPRLMLLDEPFGAVDPVTRERLQQSLLRLRRQLDLTAIFVTHDMAEAMVLADRIAVMRDGMIVQVGPPEELLRRPADDYVERLFDGPRRQVDLFTQLAAGPGHG